MASSTHYRVCHRCHTVNSADGRLVMTCECCGKHLAPFYFFDESRAMGLQTTDLFNSVKAATESKLPLKEYPPIVGLTAYWES